MRIATNGHFLNQGLIELGHELVILPQSGDSQILQDFERNNGPFDLILLELWGYNPFVLCNINGYSAPLAAYCIDSSLNEFWIGDACKLFDHVFVDQITSVDRLRTRGISATWLPLSVSSDLFVGEKREKIYDLTFVGTISEARKKRSNLIKLLSRHYSVNLVSSVSVQEMVNIFARSRIILNENLFNGLTLRVFQALASGSLLLTESQSAGLEQCFSDGHDLVCYTPDNLIEKINEILSKPEKYERIASNGQALCRLKHTSKARAEQFMQHLASGACANSAISADRRKFHEARASYMVCQRFGGNFQNSIAAFRTLADKAGECAGEALFELGNFQARNGRVERARELFQLADSHGIGIWPKLKLAMLCLHENDTAKARQWLEKALQDDADGPAEFNAIMLQALPLAQDVADLFLVLAEIYFDRQKIFDLNSAKVVTDKFPDTACEIAHLVWQLKPSGPCLELLRKCHAFHDIQGDMLPQYTYAIDNDLASPSQIVAAMETAKSYYDLGQAAVFAGKLKQKLLVSRQSQPFAVR